MKPIRALSLGAVLATVLFAQNQRQAVITGRGSPDRGKCTIEVVVDGVAQVEIRGTTASLRDLNGRPPQWRRFECTSAMPMNPPNFRFAGVDGRGRQTLVQDPRNGGAAVVQIEDPSSGAEGYTFDLTWDSRVAGPPPYPAEGPGPGYRPDYRNSDYYRRYGRGFGVDEAVRVCKDAVSQQAASRFRNAEIRFLRTRIDDSPGRNDWVIGSVDVRRGPRGDVYNFSCSVNFDNGRVRSATIDPRPADYDQRWR